MGKHHNRNNNYNNKNRNDIATINNSIDAEAKSILDKVASQSLQTNDDTNFDDLIKLFNANQLKKNMQRLLKSNQLYDKVMDEAFSRVLKNPDDFTSTELLNYMKVLQDSINNSQKTLSVQQEQINKPLIQINQQNITTNEPLSKESQQKILSVVEEFIKMMNNPNNNTTNNGNDEDKGDVVDGEVVEIVEGENNE